jgi:ABC-type lipoprotein release transport system permease subunit
MVAGVSALLLSASLMACWIPARRASRIAPQAALKEE